MRVRAKRVSGFRIVSILFGLAVFAFLPMVRPYGASAQNVSWSTQAPEFIYNQPIAAGIATSDACRYVVRAVKTGFNQTIDKVCVTEGSSSRFGLYFADSRWRSVVGLGHDEKMYRLKISCSGMNDCIYSPATDTLVMKQFLINTQVSSLVVYKNFTKRLSQTLATNGIDREYNFDLTNPDYIFERESDSYPWPVGGMAMSDNGKWLALEFRGKGVGVLSLDEFVMKRISNFKFNYTGGYQPTVELSVTNKGDFVAMAGQNVGHPKVYEVNDSCGDFPSDNPSKFSSVGSIANPCKMTQISSSSLVAGFKDAFLPRLSQDGSVLQFYATSSNQAANPSRSVQARAGVYGSSSMDYIALGDSFTSGEGEVLDSYYLPVSNDKHEKCHVSKRSYPYVLAGWLNIDSSKVSNVACSGATTKDIVGPDVNYAGQGDRLGFGGRELSDFDISSAKAQALQSFIPGRVKQIEFVELYKPLAITVGIGGNDAGLMQKLKACLSVDTCEWAASEQSRQKTAHEIKSLFGQLLQTYTDLNKASPGSKLYAVGYPRVIDEFGECSASVGFLLDSTERRFMNESVAYINQVIKSAADAAGIAYIDTWDSFGQKVLCGADSPSAMNDIRFGDDFSPISALPWLKFIGQESFHPNPLGHAMLAGSIHGTFGNITTANYCIDGAAVCSKDVSAPEPSEYWATGNQQDYVSQRQVNYARQDSNDDLAWDIRLGALSLDPGSVAKLEIHSEPTLIGEFVVNEQGGLDETIALPDWLDDGYHTFHIYGQSYSGEPVDLYQVIALGDEPVIPVSQPIEQPSNIPTNDEPYQDSEEDVAADLDTNVSPEPDTEEAQVLELSADPQSYPGQSEPQNSQLALSSSQLGYGSQQVHESSSTDSQAAVLSSVSQIGNDWLESKPQPSSDKLLTAWATAIGVVLIVGSVYLFIRRKKLDT